ncbi:MAG: P-II family nitrogen regulator [Wenzhouxiangella sp.]|nr:MAG: P-II family nitrogen regulator [Wenzhouxiangella sp.]
MRFKLIIAFVEPEQTEMLLKEARKAGASGATVITSARGEGRKEIRGILGLEIASQRDVLLFLVEQSCARQVLERLAEKGEFDESPGTGIALQLDVEDALGVRHQMVDLVRRSELERKGEH